MKSKYIWVNGKPVSFSEAKFHILNHSLHYGTAVFEGIRFYKTAEGPAIFRLDSHMERFLFSAKTMGMELPFSKKELCEAAKETVRKNGFEEGYIRPIAFWGGKMGLMPQGADLNVAIAVWEWGKYLEKDMVEVMISDVVRVHPESSVMNAKISGNYANSVLASNQAKEKGFDEALLLDYQGFIAEGPGENIFFAKDGKLYTPEKGTVLPGITRQTIITLFSEKYEIVEKKITVDEIGDFDEAFFVGTAVEVNGISKISETDFGDKEGKITGEVKEKYLSVVRGEDKKYFKWLTIVK